MPAAKSARYDAELVRQAASTRWKEILSAPTLGSVSADSLNGRHHPCPKCGGVDRFRLLDDATGALFCNQCFNKQNGDGFAALMWLRGWDFRSALSAVAEFTGVKPESNRKQHDPAKHLVFRPWNDRLVAEWCSRCKPGITPEAVRAAGGRRAIYRKDWPVIALPIESGDVSSSDPVGWVIYSQTGRKLPVWRKNRTADWVKVKTTGGSQSGLMGPSLRRLKEIALAGQGGGDQSDQAVDPLILVWKTEGPTDALALWSAIPSERDSHLVVCNAGGASEDPKPEWMDLFSGLLVHVIHDADQPGEAGAEKWSKRLAASAEDVRHVRLPFEIEKDHGKDVRDYLLGGGSYLELQRLASESPSVEPAGGPASDSTSASTAATAAGATTTQPDGRPLSNVSEERVGDQITVAPIPMKPLIAGIFARTDGWPRRVDKSLFIHDGQASEHVDYLESTDALFGWLGDRCGVVEWSRVQGCHTKAEAFHEVRRRARRHLAVESLPHEPRIPDHYYACGEFPAASDGECIADLLDRFSPASTADRWLILAMFATAFWGGPGGSRPAFVITSDAGRGVGKSKLTDMLSHLAGGCIEISQNEDAGIIRQRILSPEGSTKRIARLDNVKSLRFSRSDLESIITAPVISGRRLYVGEGTRPNTFTWALTLNGVSLSTDMAQRSVIIKLAKPGGRTGAWERETYQFIDDNRRELITDLLNFLRREPEQVQLHGRWSAWEAGVISRFPDPSGMQAVIADRAAEADAEEEEMVEVEQYFRDQLSYLRYNPDHEKIFITSQIAAKWYSVASGEKRATVGACRILSQFIQEGRTTCLQKYRLSERRGSARGFLWIGIGYSGGGIFSDIEERLLADRGGF